MGGGHPGPGLQPGVPPHRAARSVAGSDSEIEDESDGGMTEIRFVPDDKNQLDTMFNVMSDCQALHPDEDDSAEDDEVADEDEEEPGMFDDAEEETNGAGDSGDGPEQMDAD